VTTGARRTTAAARRDHREGAQARGDGGSGGAGRGPVAARPHQFPTTTPNDGFGSSVFFVSKRTPTTPPTTTAPTVAQNHGRDSSEPSPSWDAAFAGPGPLVRSAPGAAGAVGGVAAASVGAAGAAAGAGGVATALAGGGA